MAQPNTQDTQKVFNSATENFKSFVGSVENVSNTKHMQDIYANMTKLFDAFTNGALLEQGANSETLLRTVYRSLDEDFLQVVQDTEAVDKLIEVIKSKQEGIEPEKVEEAMVSETTKKVVTKTLDPDTCDPMQVVLDFIDELQTSILQVRLNLSREYERRRLEYAKSLAGQQEDLDKLKVESQEQTEQISETLGQVATDETTWKDAHLKELSRLMEKFDQATGKASDNILAQTLQEDNNLKEIAKEQKKVNWDKLISGIQGQQQKVAQVPEKKVSPDKSEDAKAKAPEKAETPPVEPKKETPKDDKKEEPKKEEAKPKEEPKDEKPKEQTSEKEKPREAEKPAEKPPMEKPPKDELGPMVPQVQKVGQDVSKVGKLKLQPPAQPKASEGSKLNVKPSKNGMHRCPICGYLHSPGGPHGQGASQMPAPTAGQPESSPSEGSKITKNGVINAIGKVHENAQKQLNNKKFRNAFMMNYSKIQGGLQKQMKKMDKTESTISKDLTKTKKGIGQLQAQARKPKGGLFGMLFGGIGGIIFTIIGGLLLITIARLALAKWKQTYMPQTDGSQMSIFGIPIPGWDSMKAIGLGIWNFITVGLPNYWDRLSNFIGNVKKQLFGKKGMFRDAIETRNTLRKIIGALIIANTKKVGGILIKILGFALSFIPGVGPFAKFLIEFAPAVYTFISTQIMLLWSNGKANAERAQQAAQANVTQMTASKSQQLKSSLLTNAKGIKPFKGQLNVMSNFLQTHKGGKGKGLPARSAIMRAVPTHTNKNFDAARNVVTEDQFSKDNKAIWDDGAVDDRVKNTKNKGDILVNINNAHEQLKKHAGEFQAEYRKAMNSSWTWKGVEEKTKDSKAKYQDKRLEILKGIYAQIKPQITAIDKYILQLSKSTRFQNVKGPLYDPNTGWNVGYRVFASDLKTPIPLTPFEAVHKQADIPFGQPAAAEVDSIGFMPFKWIQKGVQICVHPLKYELARAKAIRDIYTRYLKELEDTYKGSENADNSTAKWYTQCWTEWNYAIGKHNIGEYENEDDVLFKDRFGKFLKKLRAGQIQGKDNNLETAKGQAQGWLAETASGVLDSAGISGKEAAVVLGAGAYFGVAGAATAYVAIKGIHAAKKVAKNVNRILDYDKATDGVNGELADDKNLSWWERTKRFAKRQLRKAQALATIKEWRGTVASGVKYGDVRDFWLDSGALDLFANNSIMGTAGAAIPLIDFLVGRGILPKAPKADKANRIHDLMHWFFEKAGIKGYTWKQVMGDEVSQAGFAQVFLEYLRYKVLPQWNNVEKLLSDEITYKTQDTQKKLLKGVVTLNTLMSQKGIFDFMYKHLRFPNMQVKLIDYSNASKSDRDKLDKYREAMGIPDAKGKDSILKMLQGKWDKIGSMSDENLDKFINILKGLMQKAEFEARFSGDYTYLKQLKQYWDRLEKEKQARLDQQASGDKIVKKPGEVPTKVLEPPPKTMAEIEEEKRKAAEEEEKRKAEQEKKEKEEREKKLKEEAKRREELAIAQAKIKAMEAIRKQEENYEAILQKMIADPGKVTDKELKSLGDEVKNLKQEAENQIAKLPRDERELKLALIRGDKISEKTFSEIKETAIGLHGNLQEYINEVNQIPVGNVLAIQNTPSVNQPQAVRMQDSDSVDLGDT